MRGRLFLGTAEKIPPSELVDTTGAGDAFIGAVLYGTDSKDLLILQTNIAGLILHVLVKCQEVLSITTHKHTHDERKNHAVNLELASLIIVLHIHRLLQVCVQKCRPRKCCHSLQKWYVDYQRPSSFSVLNPLRLIGLNQFIKIISKESLPRISFPLLADNHLHPGKRYKHK